MKPFRFSLQSSSAPAISLWRENARVAEDLGYSAIYVADHLDTQLGPLVSLAVAAEATTSLHVGTLMLNNDLRNPVVLAQEIAMLGLAAEGRVEFGIGAGWMRSDYESSGIEYGEASTRVDRLSESLSILQSLWRDGEANFEGRHYSVRGAKCDPRPVLPPRVIVGGGSKRVLSLAALTADTVGVNTSLKSGAPESDIAGQATFNHFDRCLEWIREAAGDRFSKLELQILVVAAMIVPSRRAASRSASMLGFPGDEALDLPVLLIGTEDELCERLVERRERWGFSHVVVPDHAIHVFAPVVARLTGT